MVLSVITDIPSCVVVHEFAEQVLGERAAVRLFKLEEVRVVVTQMHARTSRAKMILTVFMSESRRSVHSNDYYRR